jgi:hypothetical protein
MGFGPAIFSALSMIALSRMRISTWIIQENVHRPEGCS